jgi:hypothetical protein
MILLPSTSILATILALSTLIHALPTNTVEDYSTLRFLCLTPDSTVNDYCTMNSFGPGLPLKTRTCKNLCQCTYNGIGTLTIKCQKYGCCSNLDVFNACTNGGHCDCYYSYKRDGDLLGANATMAVEDLGGPLPVTQCA